MTRQPEFLVAIDIDLPADMDQERRAVLAREERRVGAELVRSGVIARIWRLPGRSANVGIWRAPTRPSCTNTSSPFP